MMLTLAVAATDGCDAREFFAALEADRVLMAQDVEIYVLQDCTRPILAAPAGVLLETAKRKSSIFELWGLGVRKAAAPYVAFLDVRCPIEKGWLAAMRARLEYNPPALFGPVSCGWPSASAQIVGYLVEYAQFNPPLSPDLRQVPGVNLVAARCYAQHPDVLQDDGFVKTRLLAHFDAIGATPLPVEESVVAYRKTFTFSGYCAQRFPHGRCYGADRDLGRSTWPWLRAVMATPALPIVRTFRIFCAARRAQRLAPFWRWLHRIVIAEAAWSAGELVGYLLGAGASRTYLR